MTFKEKLAANQVVYGPFMHTTDPAFVESTGNVGFDFIVLDLEHGPVSLEHLQNLIRAAEIGRLYPIVRTPPGNLHMIGAVQDIGARGILVPQIKDAEEAAAVVKSARFFPKGERGLNGAVRAAKYSSIDSGEYLKNSNENTLIIQLEGKEALNNLDEILQVPDIDIFFIGPYDLSQSLGVPGEIHHPLVIENMQKIVKTAKEKGLTLGTYAGSLEDAKFWQESGIKLIAYSLDIVIFTEALKNTINQLKMNT